MTKGYSVFPFNPDGRSCHGFKEVLERYSEIVPGIQLSGPSKIFKISNKQN